MSLEISVAVNFLFSVKNCSMRMVQCKRNDDDESESLLYRGTKPTGYQMRQNALPTDLSRNILN
jgi:hypothetical protein